ncbi:MAG: heme NO-binding domain-containing protein [Burkholderiaceae bacterium]
MKGMVFTEFLDLVERTHSAELVDTLIEESDLPSGGAYTAVGNYDHREMVRLLVTLQKHTGEPVPSLLRWFGEHLYMSLAKGFPVFFEGKTHAFQVLEGIESVIHTEVRKLFPDAELPGFDVHRPGDDSLVLDYRSPRCMEDLAHGLILACIRQFGGEIAIERGPIGEERAGETRFTLRQERQDQKVKA